MSNSATNVRGQTRPNGSARGRAFLGGMPTDFQAAGAPGLSCAARINHVAGYAVQGAGESKNGTGSAVAGRARGQRHLKNRWHKGAERQI